MKKTVPPISAKIASLLWVPEDAVPDESQYLADVGQSRNPKTTDFKNLTGQLISICEAKQTTRKGLNEVLNIALWMIQQPDESPKSYGVQLLEKLAARSHMLAKTNLASAYLRGDGTAKRPAAALEQLYQVTNYYGTDQLDAHRRAHSMLGEFWCNRESSMRDVGVGQMHYRKAAEYGDPIGAFAAGLYYDRKTTASSQQSEEPNFDKAAFFYEIGVQAGHVGSQTNLGILHVCGMLSCSDKQRGWDLLEKSAADGDVIAMRSIQELKDAGLDRWHRHSR